MPDKQRSSAEIALAKEALQHIPAWLRYRDVSQRQVADYMDKSEGTVSKWLRGEQAMTVAQFFQLAQLLNAKPTDLMGSPDDLHRTDQLSDLAELANSLSSEKLELLIRMGRAMQPSHDGDT